jgi:hypothetical protein
MGAEAETEKGLRSLLPAEGHEKQNKQSQAEISRQLFR